MKWHFIAGEEGCAYAVESRCVAIVVDALRASATAAYMLQAGVTDILAVKEVDEAVALKQRFPDAILAGERGGLPLDGFKLGNSPREIDGVAGRRVVFTTTTGAGRLVQCWGAEAIYMGTTVNATAVARAALRHKTDVVVIPAGLMGNPEFSAQEDWVGACAVAIAAERLRAAIEPGEGAHRHIFWRDRIDCEGIAHLFETAPHAQKLRDVGLGDDIAFCAQVDTVDTAPAAESMVDSAVRLVRSDSAGA